MPHWAEIAAPELRGLASQGAVALWPVGSTEQHGDHLATGFDLVAAEAVCERAADSLVPPPVLLPGLSLGASQHWLVLGATLSLAPVTLAAVVADVARSVRSAGFGHLVIVNGHAGNVGPILAALGAADDTWPLVEMVSYWDLADGDEVAAACVADDGGIGHAGEVETSIGLYLGGGLVSRPASAPGADLSSGPGSRRPAFLRPPRPLLEAQTGVYGDPRPARPELGRLVVEAAAAKLAGRCQALTARRASAARDTNPARAMRRTSRRKETHDV